MRCVHHRLIALLGLWLILASSPSHAAPPQSPAPTKPPTAPPNIVFILADDLGYGDVRCFNPDGKLATPHLDRLASQGMMFTDAHSGSAVCSPTRYGILTGRYAWRTRLKSGVLWGYSPHLIEDGRLTVASMLKSRGYTTACVGKWHLGLDWPLKAGGFAQEYKQANEVDYAKPLANHPGTHGFDYFFGISGSLDMDPYLFIENDRVTNLPTRTAEFWKGRVGLTDDTFKPVIVLPTFTEKAVDFIARTAASGKPFFLYMPLNSPHTPIAPSKEWQGKSGLNAYGDFVMQTDDAIGQVVRAIDKAGIGDNTLIIVTSDNGCSPHANYPLLLKAGHNPSAQFRGNKSDIFEGGHRVPFIVRWPQRVAAGSRSDALIVHNDFMATVAQIIDYKLPDEAAEDSISMLHAMLGQPVGDAASATAARTTLVNHSVNGTFALRDGSWKLILGPSSGGWSTPKPGSDKAKTLPKVQLYNLATDIGEQNNLAAKHPDRVANMRSQLKKIVADGRSTPGKPQPYVEPVDIDR
jgi:arylsulfatase A-like enzyme